VKLDLLALPWFRDRRPGWGAHGCYDWSSSLCSSWLPLFGSIVRFTKHAESGYTWLKACGKSTGELRRLCCFIHSGEHALTDSVVSV